MTLYELTEGYKNLKDLVEDSEVPTELLDDALSQVEGDITEKVENIGKILKMLDVDMKSLKEEEERLRDRRRHCENRVKYLKEYVEQSLHYADIRKIKGKLFTFTIAKNPASVNIIDESYIPEEYIRVEVVKTVDKTKLKEALKNGERIDGAELIQREGLRVR